MELNEIQKEIDKLRIKQEEKLEKAYRKDERKKTLKEIQQEMIMFEHRKDINDYGTRWTELKQRVETLLR